MPENSKNVQVGALIGLMVEEGEDWQNVEVPAGGESAAPAPAKPSASEPVKPSEPR
jgi:pyruvate/2-oxoglutarate dehydrogenase complex dihydrolipoamide acyltransferase (E2) component